MRFLPLIRVDENFGRVPGAGEQLIRTARLRPTAKGSRARPRRSKLTAIDGPFTETKEMIGGLPTREPHSRCVRRIAATDAPVGRLSAPG